MVSKRGIESHLTQVKNLMKKQEPRKVKDVQSLISEVMALNWFIQCMSEKCRPFFKAIKCTKEVEWREDQKKAIEHIREYLNSTVELSIPEQGEELNVYLGSENQYST